MSEKKKKRMFFLSLISHFDLKNGNVQYFGIKEKCEIKSFWLVILLITGFFFNVIYVLSVIHRGQEFL